MLRWDFNPQITYEKGILSFRQLPAYVDVFLDEEDVTEQLKNDDTNESRLLQNVIAGPHTLYFSGHFVESKRVSTIVNPNVTTKIEPELKLFGEVDIQVKTPPGIKTDYRIELIGSDSPPISFSGRDSDSYTTLLDPGNYIVNARFLDDPEIGLEEDIEIVAGSVKTIRIPLQYSMQYLTNQLQSLRDETSTKLKEIQEHRALQIMQLRMKHDSNKLKLQHLKKRRTSATTWGIIFNLIGIASTSASVVFYIGTSNAIAAYNASTTETEAHAFALQAKQYHGLFLTSSVVGVGTLLFGNILLLTRPSINELQQSIDQLETQIWLLNSLEKMGL